MPERDAEPEGADTRPNSAATSDGNSSDAMSDADDDGPPEALNPNRERYYVAVNALPFPGRRQIRELVIADDLNFRCFKKFYYIDDDVLLNLTPRDRRTVAWWEPRVGLTLVPHPTEHAVPQHHLAGDIRSYFYLKDPNKVTIYVKGLELARELSAILPNYSVIDFNDYFSPRFSYTLEELDSFECHFHFCRGNVPLQFVQPCAVARVWKLRDSVRSELF